MGMSQGFWSLLTWQFRDRDLFWDGEWKRDPKGKVVGDLQRSGIKRSRIESPGNERMFVDSWFLLLLATKMFTLPETHSKNSEIQWIEHDISFWDGLLSEAMLASGSVIILTFWGNTMKHKHMFVYFLVTF